MQPGNPFAPAPPTAAPNPFAPMPAANPFGQTVAPAASPFAQAATPTGDASEEFGLAPKGEAAGPRIRDYGIGRLVLVRPNLIERVKNTLSQDRAAMQDRITADIVALDGDPVPWGGKPEGMPPVPHDKIMPIGTLVEDFYIGQVALTRALKKFLPPARKRWLLARIGISDKSKPGQNAAWLFNPDSVTQADIQRAAAWIGQYNASTIGSA